jgi:hypothetical protein
MKIDDEDTRSYEQRQFFEKNLPSSFQLDGLTIFFAVLAAIIAAWFIRDAYERWQIEQAMKELNRQLQISAEQSNRAMQEIQSQQQYAYAKAKEAARLEAENKQREKERLRQQQLADQELRTIALKNLAKKEQAWQNYYKPITGCESANPNRETVKCGNDYIKARRNFEQIWSTKHIDVQVHQP